MYLLILILILYINTQEPEEKISCSLNTICDDCQFCEDYSNCNFFNIFCYQNNSGDYMRNEELQNNLSLYYKNDKGEETFDPYFLKFNSNNEIVLRQPIGLTYEYKLRR